MNDTSIRVRFAPSPTGHLHIGGLRSAIFNWLFARHANGKFLLRIEDTDRERSKKEYTDSILASFAWMNLDWDEPVVIQSQRLARHQEIVQELLAQNKAYYCACMQEDLVKRLSTIPGSDSQFLKYDGYCWEQKKAGKIIASPAAIRFRIPDSIIGVDFYDLIRGHISIGLDQLDDFIIVRSDGTPMYNFVVVVDDADMQISHVIRGEEHIANTPKQILLYQACEFNLPKFAHLPMILGPDGNKLSKRDAATGVHEYRQLGYLPQALFNYLVRLGWAHGDQEIFTCDQMIQLFDLEHVGKKGAIFDQQKLDWINGVYIRNTPDAQLLTSITSDVYPTFEKEFYQWDTAKIIVLIGIYKQRAKTLLDLVNNLKELYVAPGQYNTDDYAKWIHADTAQYLQEMLALLEKTTLFLTDALSQQVKEWATQKNIKIVSVAQPLRIAMIGKSDGPGVFELMAVLGKEETIQRIKNLLAKIKN